MKLAKSLKTVSKLKAPERRKAARKKGPTGARALAVIEKKYQCMVLRRDGRTYLQIAETLNITASTAAQYVKEVLAETINTLQETADESRQLAVQRLDRFIDVYTPLAFEEYRTVHVDPRTGLEVVVVNPPNTQYAALILKAEERRAKLLALDKAPEKGAAEETGIRVYIGVDVDMV